MWHKFLLSFATTAMSVIVACLAGMLTLTTLPMIETRLFPVVEDWQVTDVRVDGYDLIVAGTVVKKRDCTYVPPPRARDSMGVNLLVRSESPTANISWPASDGPQRFGPWRVVNGADREIQFFFNHDCHFLYNVFTPLGTVPPQPYKP